MDIAINQDMKFDLITCYSCGIPFFVPYNWKELRSRDHKEFFCPNGHEQHYLKSQEDLLKLLNSIKGIVDSDVAAVQELEPFVTLSRMIYDRNAVRPDGLEKVLKILVDFQKSQEDK